MVTFNVIVAVDAKNGIGKDGVLPWYLPEDLKHFKEITCVTNLDSKKNVVIMGRRTWESIPSKFRPLEGRINLVLTRNAAIKFPDGVLTAESFEKAFELLGSSAVKKDVGDIYVIGGQEVFKEAVSRPECRKIYMTRILKSFNCDTFFPQIHNCFEETLSSPHYKRNSQIFYFVEYVRKKDR